MRQETLDFIKVLTERDRKTLGQKGNKLAAETGELNQAILPLEGAPDTLHRLTSRHHVLDEVADVILAALSIGYSLGFNDQDLDDMLRTKMNKWSGLQAQEGTVKFPIPFEIHITVGSEVLNHEEVLFAFRDFCFRNEMKCLDIEPYHVLRGYDPFKADVMCSKVVFGTQQEAMDVMTKLVYDLTRHTMLNVVRQKIETLPWHPIIKQLETEGKPVGGEPGVYLETHIEIVTPGAEDIIRQAVDLSFKDEDQERYALFMSVNRAKQNAPLILTYRHAGITKSAYDDNLKTMLYHLREDLGLTVLKTITELSIFDTAPNHDAEVYA